jgi:hypothetical protein
MLDNGLLYYDTKGGGDGEEDGDENGEGDLDGQRRRMIKLKEDGDREIKECTVEYKNRYSCTNILAH